MNYPLLWFILWAVLWAGYFALDGFDLGAGMLAPFLAKTDAEKEEIISAIGPFWDGNEVWLVAAGGVTFAAFPGAYASLFSWFYSALFIALAGLIIRGVSLEFIRKADDARIKRILWLGLSLGSFLATVIFGVAFGNIFRGLYIGPSGYEGGLPGLLNPYALFTGLLFVAFFLLHGSLWLGYKTILFAQKASRAARLLLPAVVLLLIVFSVYSAYGTGLGFNYKHAIFLALLPALCISAVAGIKLNIGSRPGAAFLYSFVAIAAFILSGMAGIYPALLSSTLNPFYSITIYNAASSSYTLKIMTIVTALFLPVIIAYQLWFYKLFRKPLSSFELKSGGMY